MKKPKTKKMSMGLLSLNIFFICFLLGSFCTAQGAITQDPGKITVSGTVTDTKGEPLIGVSVVLKNADVHTGTITDIDGKYSLPNIPSNGTLEFSSVGMTKQQIAINNRTTIDVTMQDDAILLGETVVIGYGSVKKSDLTGSVASIKADAIKDIPANSVEGLLQGRAAGLQIINSSQDPGAGATVRIRGGSSLRGSNSPLIVVDGFPLGDAGDLKQINTQDIVSMEILKDASASAIYGSRGANGVIIVTTRQAKTGKTEINIRQQTTLSQFTSKFNLWRDPVLMATLSNEAYTNAGWDPLYIGATNSTGTYYPSISELQTTWKTNTKWDDIVFRGTPVSNNTTVQINSSTERTSFNLSANYYDEQGIYIDDDYSKFGYNLGINHNLFSNVKVKVSNILYKGNRDNNGGLAYWRNPIYPVYNEDGSYFKASELDYENPVAISKMVKNKVDMLDMMTSGALEWDIIDGLKFTSQVNYKYGKSTTDQYYPKTYTKPGTDNDGRGVISNWESQNFVTENYLNFNRTINEKHELGIMAGHSYEYYKERSSSLTANGFVNEALNNENMGAGDPEKNGIGNGFGESKLVSGMGRINYTYDNKYLATFTFRADGSSKFGENNKWAYFPSGALSWKAQEEDFIKNLNIFDELKFRISYGVSGNQGIGSYQTLSRYSTSKYYDDGAWTTTIGPGYVSGWIGDYLYRIWAGIPNPDLKWETTAQVDFGLDMAFFNRRLRLTLDYYDKQTKDLLRERNLPISSSYQKMWVNDGEIQNRGFEVTVAGDIYNNKDWDVSGTLMFSRNRNKVKSLGNSVQSGLKTNDFSGLQFEYFGNNLEMYRDYTNILAIGQPINVFYGYKVDGIVQSLQEGLDAGLSGDYAQPGEFKYIDIDGDGAITELDKVVIGDPNPDFIASLNLSARWKNLDASIFLNAVVGNDVLNTKAWGEPSTSPLRWTPDNPTNKYPRLREGRQTRISDWWVQDGSFLRIQDVSVGYTFNLPKQKVFASKLRVYMNVSNLYTFTKFDGYDPEVDQMGVYYGGYPRLRKWTFGLNLTF
ncbi:TonB-dependent receptor [Dysgonomonas sp. 521]|uniref:SusC/RagA family TonB-linked outer membrane protein n=1 Tax=Dysgonomonas sp. 521 TaxID=2302932 RepID=UPI0013CF5E7F|nr:TonB-dependent receptor [Dysgonomonas sp. 521]NDV93987.1 TonB-dependent receptor [Dysgonomonas sp. 521]